MERRLFAAQQAADVRPVHHKHEQAREHGEGDEHGLLREKRRSRRENDGADQAKHIFRSLRALDEQGDGVVYARCPRKDGLSMAVYNRLIRAAAFRVISL